MEAKHTPFREALMTAFVRGWYDGLDRRKDAEGRVTDARKIETANEIAAKFPVEDAARDLLGVVERTTRVHDDGTPLGAAARAAIAKATKAKGE